MNLIIIAGFLFFISHEKSPAFFIEVEVCHNIWGHHQEIVLTFIINMIESSFIEYLMYFSPVIFGHVIFPPLSYFVGDKNEFLQSVVYPNLPPEFFERRLIQSMLLDQNQKDVVETYVTHMFVHVTYQHLFSNLFSAIQLGYPVYCEFGVFGLYAVFFGGGVFASVPSPLHLGQKKQVKKDYENIFSSFGKQYLPPFLGGAWDGVNNQLVAPPK